MRRTVWYILIFLVLTGVYAFQLRQEYVEKHPPPTPTPAPTPDPELARLEKETARIRAFLGTIKLGSTMPGTPGLAIIDGHEYSEGSLFPALPDIDLTLSRVGDGFVILQYKNKTFRVDLNIARQSPPATPTHQNAPPTRPQRGSPAP